MTVVETNTSAVSPTAVVTEVARSTAINMAGFRHDSSRFEVQGRLTNSTPFDFEPINEDADVEASDPFHDMIARIAFMDSASYADCSGTPATLKSLIGLRMAGGWV